ncbi:MAG: hypothetical protein F6K10_21840 [Moorea sp. SIO2B7]|nr:hypothetical protein [Moorena sp. SIO2B7]
MAEKTTRIDIAALVIASLTAIVTAVLTIRTNELSKKINQREIFISAVEHLADNNPVRRRLAIISLADIATNPEEVIQVVKAIIISSRNDLETKNDAQVMLGDRSSELGILFQIASLDDGRAELYKEALEDEQVKELIAIFLPLSRTTVSQEQIENVPDPDPTTDKIASSPPVNESIVVLENQTLSIELKSLVSNIYSSERTTRRSSTAILARDSWRSYDQLLVRELTEAYARDPDNYFGIVNSLHLLNKVSDVSIQDNLDGVKMLVNRAKSLLSLQDRDKYLAPIVKKISSK